MALRPPAIGQYEPQVPVEEGLRRVIPEARGISAGPEIAELGGAAQRIAVSDAANYVGPALAQLRLGAEQSLLSASQEPTKEVTDKGLTPVLMEQYSRALSAAKTQAPNDLARRMLDTHGSEFGAEYQMRVMRQDAEMRLQQRASGALDGINRVATAVELAPDTWQQAGAQQIGSIQALGLDPETTHRLTMQADQAIGEAAGRGYATQDPQHTLQRLSDPNDSLFAGLPLQSRAQLQEYAQGKLVEAHANAIVQAFRTGGPQVGAQAFTAVDSNPTVPDELRGRILAAAHAGIEQWHAEAAEEHAQQITALDTAIASAANGTGSVPPNARSRAADLYHAGAFDEQQYVGTLDNIGKAEKKANEQFETLNYALDAYAKRTPLDPRDKGDQGAADLLLQHSAAGQPPGSPTFTNRVLDITSRVGVVPGAAVSWARASLNGGDTNAAAGAADLLERISEENPRAYGFAVDDKTRALAAQISDAVKAGTPAAVAVNLARTNANADEAQRKVLDQVWTQQKAQASQAGALSSLLKSDDVFKPHWYSSLPAVPPDLQGQFDQLTRNYFSLTGGNLQQARNLAVSDLKHVWGASEAVIPGQRVITQFPPEQMFPGLTAQVVRDDIAQTVKGNAQAFMHLDPATGKLTSLTVDPAQVRLIATDHTARTGGREWALGAPDQFGAMDVLRGKDGNPLLYRLPVSQTDYAAVRDREAAAAVAAARQRRSDAQLIEQMRAQDEAHDIESVH